MVTKYGMSEALGKVAINYEDNGRSVSSETRNLVETEVASSILQSACCIGIIMQMCCVSTPSVTPVSDQVDRQANSHGSMSSGTLCRN